MFFLMASIKGSGIQIIKYPLTAPCPTIPVDGEPQEPGKKTLIMFDRDPSSRIQAKQPGNFSLLTRDPYYHKGLTGTVGQGYNQGEIPSFYVH